MPHTDNLILGGGISGLLTAYRLKHRGESYALLEASARCGGVLQTTREAGFLFEHGANTLVADDALLAQFKALRLAYQHPLASAKRKYIFDGTRSRRLQRVSLRGLLAGRLLTPREKWRAASELWRGAPHTPNAINTEADESVYDFFATRFGAGVCDALIDPVVSGIWAGDMRALAMPAAFQTLSAMAENIGSGSLLRELLGKKAQQGNARRQIVGLADGMGAWCDALHQALAPHVYLNHTATSIVRKHENDGQRNTPCYQVRAGNDTFTAKRVFICLPHAATRALFADPASNLLPNGATLPDVAYVPLASIGIGFENAAIRKRLFGLNDKTPQAIFPTSGGILIPRRSGMRTLGVLFNHHWFENRAPKSGAMLTVLMGGAHDEALHGTARGPDILAHEDMALLALALADMGRMLNLSAVQAEALETAVRWYKIARYPTAIPQCGLDTRANLQAFRARLPDGVHLFANWGFDGASGAIGEGFGPGLSTIAARTADMVARLPRISYIRHPYHENHP